MKMVKYAIFTFSLIGIVLLGTNIKLKAYNPTFFNINTYHEGTIQAVDFQANFVQMNVDGIIAPNNLQDFSWDTHFGSNINIFVGQRMYWSVYEQRWQMFMVIPDGFNISSLYIGKITGINGYAITIKDVNTNTSYVFHEFYLNYIDYRINDYVVWDVNFEKWYFVLNYDVILQIGYDSRQNEVDQLELEIADLAELNATLQAEYQAKQTQYDILYAQYVALANSTTQYEDGRLDMFEYLYAHGFEGISFAPDTKDSGSFSYKAGETVGMTNSFTSNFHVWIVPAIILVLIGGGAISIMKMRGRND